MPRCWKNIDTVSAVKASTLFPLTLFLVSDDHICHVCNKPPRLLKDPPPNNEKVQEGAAQNAQASTNKPTTSAKKSTTASAKKKRPASSKKRPASIKKGPTLKRKHSSSDEPTKGHRTKNWQPTETKILLKIVWGVLPTDDKEWGEVKGRFLSRDYPDNADEEVPVRDYGHDITHVKKLFN